MARGFLNYGLSSEPNRPSYSGDEPVKLSAALGGGRATVVRVFDRVNDLWQIKLPDGTYLVIGGVALYRATPTWRAGDVVVVKHGGYGSPYNYVRGTNGWLTEHGDKSDEIVDKWYRAGWVTPKLQSGGELFDTGRL